MSEENVAMVREWYERFNAIGETEPGAVDIRAIHPDLWPRIDPDLELHERADLPGAKVYRGRDEAISFLHNFWELFSEIHWKPIELIEVGDAVVVVTKVNATGRESRVEVEMEDTNVWWFRDGKVVRLQAFPTKQDALAAVEAGPQPA